MKKEWRNYLTSRRTFLIKLFNCCILLSAGSLFNYLNEKNQSSKNEIIKSYDFNTFAVGKCNETAYKKLSQTML